MTEPEHQPEPEDRDLDFFSQDMNAGIDLDEATDYMIREAQSVLSKHPHADPVGVVFQRAVLSPDSVAALEKTTGQPFPQKGFLAVMPRQMANQLLQNEDPNLLAELAHFPGGRGTQRQLPIVCVTKNGAKMKVVGYEAPA